MLITNNGSIEAFPHTSMLKHEGAWRYLLVCRVSPDHTDEELTALFNTASVEDDAIGCRWTNTEFVNVAQDEQYKYVWLFYTERVMTEQFSAKLNEMEQQLAETDEATIGLFEAALEQEEVNVEQDEAIIAIYEMMEGTING